LNHEEEPLGERAKSGEKLRSLYPLTRATLGRRYPGLRIITVASLRFLLRVTDEKTPGQNSLPLAVRRSCGTCMQLPFDTQWDSHT